MSTFLCDNIFEKLKKYFQNYSIIFYLFCIFMVGILFMSTRLNRNIFYLLGLFFFVFECKKAYFKKLLRSKLFIFVLIYITYSCMTIIWFADNDLYNTLNFLSKLFKVSIFVIIGSYVFSNDILTERKFIDIFSFCGGVISFFTIIYFYWIQQNSFGMRLAGFGKVEYYTLTGGVYGLVFLMALFTGIKDSTSIKHKILYLSTAFVSFLYVLLTQSRGPLLAVLIAAIVGIVLYRKIKMFYTFFILGLLPTALIHYCGIYDLTSLVTRGDSYRVTIWQQAVTLIREKLIVGYGLGSHYDFFYINTKTTHPHNMYLYNMLDGGMVALFLLLMLMFMAMFLAFKFYAAFGNPILVVLLVFSFLVSLTDSGRLLSNPGFEWICFWLPVTLCLGVELHKDIIYDKVI